METADATQSETKPNKQKARRQQRPSAEPPSSGIAQRERSASNDDFELPATVLEKTVVVGNQELAYTLKRKWTGLHRSLWYITSFAPTAIGGRVVSAACTGLEEYIDERLEAANALLKGAQDRAAEAGIKAGTFKKKTTMALEMACPMEMDVLDLIAAYDDYLVVMDSMWILKGLMKEEKEGAHKMVRDDMRDIVLLVAQLRSKLVNYRREKGFGELSMTEEALVTDIEDLIMAQLSEEAQREHMEARRRIEERAKRREANAAASAQAKAEESTRAGAATAEEGSAVVATVAVAEGPVSAAEVDEVRKEQQEAEAAT